VPLLLVDCGVTRTKPCSTSGGGVPVITDQWIEKVCGASSRLPLSG
jgi:hypothetical protein